MLDTTTEQTHRQGKLSEGGRGKKEGVVKLGNWLSCRLDIHDVMSLQMMETGRSVHLTL